MIRARDFLWAGLWACAAVAQPPPPANDEFASRTLVVLAAPGVRDRYYRPLRDDILDFQIAYAKSILGRDNVVILGDRQTLRRLARDLPEDVLLEAPMRDIWTRDFFPARPEDPILFRYAAAAQSGKQDEADGVQDGFRRFAKRQGLTFRRAPWILDGGNVVDNGRDKAIVTDRFLSDNHLDKAQALAILRETLGVEQVAILPAHPDDRLGHADGMASFIGTNTIAITRYADESPAAIRQELQAAFPGVRIVELETDFDEDAFDPAYGSARGIHVNATVTDRFIYLPVFGMETDAPAIQQIQAATDKEVVPIEAGKVARMGGSVRCLGAQLKGENASRLIEAARER